MTLCSVKGVDPVTRYKFRRLLQRLWLERAKVLILRLTRFCVLLYFVQGKAYATLPDDAVEANVFWVYQRLFNSCYNFKKNEDETEV